MSWRAGYEADVADVSRQFAALPGDATVRLAKATSNLFRPRQPRRGPGLDVSAFGRVLAVDTDAGIAEVGGMTTYEDLVAATLPRGYVPLCVPQLRTITLGGAVTGLGIESASWRNGLPHESVLEMDVLTGTGEVVTVGKTDEDPHADLFAGFPNSYGSLGYALRLQIELEAIKPYVQLSHVRVGSATEAAAVICAVIETGVFCGAVVDFLDCTVFGIDELYLTLGAYTDDPGSQRPRDRRKQHIYYQSVRSQPGDLLSTHDYLWRWDTDWFWCSRAFGAQHPLIRPLWPADLLRSDVYWRLIALDRRFSFSTRLDQVRRRPPREHVIQDVEVPIDRLPAFLDFFHREIGITPIWLCPLRQRDASRRWPLYDFDPTVTYVNVGFWSTVALPNGIRPDDSRLNRRIEAVVTELGGRKSLYSTAYYSRETFDRLYGGTAYELLVKRYNPDGRFPSLYDKAVGRK